MTCIDNLNSISVKQTFIQTTCKHTNKYARNFCLYIRFRSPIFHNRSLYANYFKRPSRILYAIFGANTPFPSKQNHVTEEKYSRTGIDGKYRPVFSLAFDIAHYCAYTNKMYWQLFGTTKTTHKWFSFPPRSLHSGNDTLSKRI